MIDPSLPIQAALIQALRDDAAVTALLGSRVWDRVPTSDAGLVYPQITLGPTQVVNEGNGCGDQADVFIQLDCWSRAVGYPEVRRVAAAACAALSSSLTVTGFRVVVQDIESINYRREPDGLTSRAIIDLRLNVVPTP